MDIYIGPKGVAHKVKAEPKNKDQEATLACWFLDIPQGHIFWNCFLLSVIHLREIEGQTKSAVKDYPEAEYELLVVALDPKKNPDPHDQTTWRYLLPVNVSIQFHGATDGQAADVARVTAKAVTDGLLPVETSGIWGAKEYWKETILKTVEHYTKGY